MPAGLSFWLASYIRGRFYERVVSALYLLGILSKFWFNMLFNFHYSITSIGMMLSHMHISQLVGQKLCAIDFFLRHIYMMMTVNPIINMVIRNKIPMLRYESRINH